MVKHAKYVVVLLLAGCLVYLLGSFSRGIEREIADFPLLELIQGKGGIGLLKPLGVDLVLFTATLLIILTITGLVVLAPGWFSAVYTILAFLFLTAFLGSKVGLVFGGFLLIAISRHLFGAKKEIHLRIQFSPDLISHRRNLVALVLLLVLFVPVYKGSKELLENKGTSLQRVAEDQGAKLIDRQVPKLVDQMLHSELIAPLLEKLPAEDLQKEILSHFPKGAVVVAKVKEQIPKIVSFLRDEARRTPKGGFQGLLLLVMLASSFLFWPISILMILARALSAISGLLTKATLFVLTRIGVIKEAEEEVKIKRLVF